MLVCQSYKRILKTLCESRGWESASHLEKYLLFSEEVGELAKAIREHLAIGLEEGKKTKTNLEEEFADVLNYLLDLANGLEVDLQKAFWKKDAINQKRKWR